MNNIFYRTRATAYKMWNTSDSMPEYADVKKAFDKIGRVPGYKSVLPEPVGESKMISCSFSEAW